MKGIEKIPWLSKEETEKARAETKFLNKEIAEIKPATIELAKQLKEKIEQGGYDALISDDAGGRIPTLLLRKIFNSVNPAKKVETLFIASGQLYFPQEGTEDYKKLLDYLKNFKEVKEIKKALLVTQFVFKGDTLAKLLYALEEVGISADAAVLEVAFPDELRARQPEGTNIFIGSVQGHMIHKISEEHEKLSGVTKARPYSPIPQKYTKRIVTYEDFKKLQEKYYGEKSFLSEDAWKRTREAEINEEYERMTHEPITSEDIKRIQSAREDINLLSKDVVGEVWGEK
jgi:hypothetical protein